MYGLFSQNLNTRSIPKYNKILLNVVPQNWRWDFVVGYHRTRAKVLKNSGPEAIDRFLQIRHTNPHPNSDLPKLMEVLGCWVGVVVWGYYYQGSFK